MATDRKHGAYLRVALIVSPSGASETCPICGTIYDRHELVGYVPPVGDGCDNCVQEIPDE